MHHSDSTLYVKVCRVGSIAHIDNCCIMSNGDSC